MSKMERYDENEESVENVTWTKYKIIVPTERDRKELMDSFESIHNTWEVDTGIVAVNQLVHEYLTPERSGNPLTKNNIIVDKELYDKLDEEKKYNRFMHVLRKREKNSRKYRLLHKHNMRRRI